jgi:hypothetical protein
MLEFEREKKPLCATLLSWTLERLIPVLPLLVATVPVARRAKNPSEAFCGVETRANAIAFSADKTGRAEFGTKAMCRQENQRRQGERMLEIGKDGESALRDSLPGERVNEMCE